MVSRPSRRTLGFAAAGIVIATAVGIVVVFTLPSPEDEATREINSIANSFDHSQPSSAPTTWLADSIDVNEVTNFPTASPTSSPSTSRPTHQPSEKPTVSPTASPSRSPSVSPTHGPTLSPTYVPTKNPTTEPTRGPTSAPNFSPTQSPSTHPTTIPSQGISPSNTPTKFPTKKAREWSPPLSGNEIDNPTILPTKTPTYAPSKAPTFSPSMEPTKLPTVWLSSNTPTKQPTEWIPATHTPTQSPTNTPILCFNAWAAYTLFGLNVYDVKPVSDNEYGTVLSTTDETSIQGGMHVFTPVPGTENMFHEKVVGNYEISVDHAHENLYAVSMNATNNYWIEEVNFSSSTELESFCESPGGADDYRHNFDLYNASSSFGYGPKNFETSCLRSFVRVSENEWGYCQANAPDCSSRRLLDERNLAEFNGACYRGNKILLRARICTFEG